MMNAPKVTLADIEANIVKEIYFTAADALRFNYLVSDPKDEAKFNICAELDSYTYSDACLAIEENIDIPIQAELTTFCMLILKNGFAVTGGSNVVSPENFNAEIGVRIARENAINQIWPLMGYALKTEMYNDLKTNFNDTIDEYKKSKAE